MSFRARTGRSGGDASTATNGRHPWRAAIQASGVRTVREGFLSKEKRIWPHAARTLPPNGIQRRTMAFRRTRFRPGPREKPGGNAQNAEESGRPRYATGQGGRATAADTAPAAKRGRRPPERKEPPNQVQTAGAISPDLLRLPVGRTASRRQRRSWAYPRARMRAPQQKSTEQRETTGMHGPRRSEEPALDALLRSARSLNPRASKSLACSRRWLWTPNDCWIDEDGNASRSMREAERPGKRAHQTAPADGFAALFALHALHRASRTPSERAPARATRPPDVAPRRRLEG